MEQFGRYLLLEKIAKGGMAEVYRAASTGSAGFAKIVAIKRILPHLAEEAAFVSMLIDEAKIAATLNHPNILQVLDLGTHQGQHFIAMEFVVGQSLDQVIVRSMKNGKPLPQPFAVHCIAQALHGLAYAHQKTDAMGEPCGIIHRDISPQNIMVGYDGSVKLADFGIARAADRTTHTVTGTIKGKPGYMSPEQVLGKQIDQRLDIYAMGVVLHELLTGKRMRKGTASDVQILLAVAEGKYPTFDEMGVQVPEELAAVVYKALAPDPENRWQDAHSFALALEEVIRSLGWHYSLTETGTLMRGLFPAEVQREKTAMQHFQNVLLRGAPEAPAEPSLVVDVEEPQATGSQLPTVQRRNAAGTPAPTSVPTPNPQAAVPNLPTPPPVAASARLPAPPVEMAPQPAATKPAKSSGGAVIFVVVSLLVAGGGGGFYAWRQSQAASAVAGALVIETDPPGARILVAGKPQPGVTPLVVEGLRVGPVEVEAKLDGMQPAKTIVMLSEGASQTARIALKASVVRVPIATRPAGASILVDGVLVGKSPMQVELAGNKRVSLTLELAGHQSLTQTIDPAQAPPSLDLALEPVVVAAAPAPVEPAKPVEKPASKPAQKGASSSKKPVDDEPEAAPAPAGPGKLTVVSRPWAQIFIDGRDTGKFTPQSEMTISSGKHSIKLVNSDFGISKTINVDVRPGQTVSLSEELK